MTRPVVEAQDLVKRYQPPRRWLNLRQTGPEKVALAGLSLAVERGEIFGLLGPNGAGKTTLLRVLVGLVTPDEGTASVNGHDVVTAGRQVRSTIGVVYGDERSFFWRLSVRENLRFYARLFGLSGATANRRISELIELVGLTEAANLPMHSYSSGMRQRASIARGLVNDPPLLFMDEPTRSLDPVGSQELRRLIAERVAAGRTVLFATNLMHEAEALCDRLMLIDHGHELVTGTVKEFRQKVTSDVVYQFVLEGSGSCSPEDLAAISGVRQAEVDQTKGGPYLVKLVLDGESSALPAAIRHLMENSLEIVSCTRQELSLDEVFRELVHRRREEVAL